MLHSGLNGAPYSVTVDGLRLTMQNAQRLVDDFSRTPAKKQIIDLLMPSVLMSELPVERSFARDKSATSYRNLSMQVCMDNSSDGK